MLKKINRLTKKKDFDAVMQGKGLFSPFLIIKYKKNSQNLSRFGIIISKKVSKKATLRNLVKRRISEIIRLNLDKFTQGFDLVIIASPLIIDKQEMVLKYKEIEKILLSTLRKSGLL
ncbi:MAG: ribonuclease P protein component [Candidatus Parcubacteria bacterium]|nr:ribonuclease P protein component [Candidatus Parcubacteria bacterium]